MDEHFEQILGNPAIENAAITFVIEQELAQGRTARDARRSGVRGAPDVVSDDRIIEVKGLSRWGLKSMGLLLFTPGQVEEGLRNPHYYVYIVENVAQGDTRKFELRVLQGEDLRRLFAGAKPQRMYVPLRARDYTRLPRLDGASTIPPLSDQEDRDPTSAAIPRDDDGQVAPPTRTAGTLSAKPHASMGCPDIDDALAGFPDTLPQAIEGIGPYTQVDGYKCWKVGRRNWLQWNDGTRPLTIRFDNSLGEVRTWKLFARFGEAPGEPWEKPSEYGDYKFMPSGPDVWGCSCEGLREYLTRVRELERHLRDDLTHSHQYSVQQYR